MNINIDMYIYSKYILYVYNEYTQNTHIYYANKNLFCMQLIAVNFWQH